MFSILHSALSMPFLPRSPQKEDRLSSLLTHKSLSPNDMWRGQLHAVSSKTAGSHKSHLVHQVLHSSTFPFYFCALNLTAPCLKKKRRGLQRELQKNKSREAPETNPHLARVCLTQIPDNWVQSSPNLCLTPAVVALIQPRALSMPRPFFLHTRKTGFQAFPWVNSSLFGLQRRGPLPFTPA